MAGLIEEISSKPKASAADKTPLPADERTPPTLHSGTLTGTDASGVKYRRTRSATLAFALLAGVAIFATAWVLRGSRDADPERANAEPPVGAETASSVDPSLATSAAPPPGPTASLDATAPSIASASSTPSAESSVPASAAPPVPARRNPSRPSPQPKAKVDCNPPYTINAQGRKIYKRQCLE